MIDAEDLKRVMELEEGRRFMAGLLSLCKVNGREEAKNALQEAYRSGRRAVGEELCRQIKNIESPDETKDGLALFYLMEREAKRHTESEE